MEQLDKGVELSGTAKRTTGLLYFVPFSGGPLFVLELIITEFSLSSCLEVTELVSPSELLSYDP
ncbi:hypothetical protein CHS0354_029204, partial [Potamilus streckersoni]